MGTGSKVLCVLLRLSELVCSVIVVACLGRFFYLLNIGNGSYSSRLVYAEVISALGIIFSVLLIVPAKYSFYAWPLDVIMFILFIVAFGLLAALNSSCSSGWYYDYWGYYWGRFWTLGPRFTVRIGAGCNTWRSILAFLFMGGMAWFLSAILGVFVWYELRAGNETHHTRNIKEKVLHKKHGNQRSVDPEAQFQPDQSVQPVQQVRQ